MVIPSMLGKKDGQGLVLYDGVCVLCSGWFRFVARRDIARKFRFTAIQSDSGRALALELGIDPDDPQTNAVLLDDHVYFYSDSALSVLSELPNWRWTRVFLCVPKRLRDGLTDWSRPTATGCWAAARSAISAVRTMPTASSRDCWTPF
jgi:predicted DCC family thiol-disulfide oxidoreductase YuxK